MWGNVSLMDMAVWDGREVWTAEIFVWKWFKNA
jgi:hypothetical protein